MVSRGNGGGISCRQQSLKRRTFENLTAIEWLGGVGKRGKKNRLPPPPPPPYKPPNPLNKLYDFSPLSIMRQNLL